VGLLGLELALALALALALVALLSATACGPPDATETATDVDGGELDAGSIDAGGAPPGCATTVIERAWRVGMVSPRADGAGFVAVDYAGGTDMVSVFDEYGVAERTASLGFQVHDVDVAVDGTVLAVGVRDDVDLLLAVWLTGTGAPTVHSIPHTTFFIEAAAVSALGTTAVVVFEGEDGTMQRNPFDIRQVSFAGEALAQSSWIDDCGGCFDVQRAGDEVWVLHDSYASGPILEVMSATGVVSTHSLDGLAEGLVLASQTPRPVIASEFASSDVYFVDAGFVGSRIVSLPAPWSGSLLGGDGRGDVAAISTRTDDSLRFAEILGSGTVCPPLSLLAPGEGGSGGVVWTGSRWLVETTAAMYTIE
jgi:hypothetical protein